MEQELYEEKNSGEEEIQKKIQMENKERSQRRISGGEEKFEGTVRK